MPTCESCGHQWSWLQTISKLFTFKRKQNCPYCGRPQYFKTSIAQSWFMILIPLMIFGLPLLGVDDHYAIGISFFVLIIDFASMPFFVRLCSDKDKALFIEDSRYFD